MNAPNYPAVLIVTHDKSAFVKVEPAQMWNDILGAQAKLQRFQAQQIDAERSAELEAEKRLEWREEDREREQAEREARDEYPGRWA